jgi:multiple sugar transport system permease protein
MRLRVLGLGARLTILMTFAVFFAAPVIWLILAPTKTDKALITSNPFAFGDFHQVALAWKHLNAYSDNIYRRWILNTLYYALTATAITLAVSVPAGYGLAFGRFPGRKLILSVTLVVMIVPAAALVLPIFLELNAMHLIGRSLSVILPFSFFPFGVYLTYIYFTTAISRDLLDAARIDGASEVEVFSKIAMPLATPVIALVGFFSLTNNWNNYFLPYVMLPGRKAPIQVGLAELLSNVPQFNVTNAGSVTISLSGLALATLIAVAPVLIVFLFAQRFLVSGMTAGGTKE